MSASMMPFADKAGVTPPTGPDSDHQKKYDKLNGLAGGDFDKKYIDQMVTDHAKALDAFTTEAKDTTDLKAEGESPERQDHGRGSQKHSIRRAREAVRPLVFPSAGFPSMTATA